MSDNRILSDDIKSIAESLIDTDEDLIYIKDSRVSIAYLESDKELKKDGKSVLGQCEKVGSKYKWCCPYDFMITIFVPNIEELSPEQLRILVKHELLHVGIIDKEGGEEVYKVKPHDIEDFKIIIEEFGIGWAESVI